MAVTEPVFDELGRELTPRWCSSNNLPKKYLHVEHTSMFYAMYVLSVILYAAHEMHTHPVKVAFLNINNFMSKGNITLNLSHSSHIVDDHRPYNQVNNDPLIHRLCYYLLLEVGMETLQQIKWSFLYKLQSRVFIFFPPIYPIWRHTSAKLRSEISPLQLKVKSEHLTDTCIHPQPRVPHG